MSSTQHTNRINAAAVRSKSILTIIGIWMVLGTLFTFQTYFYRLNIGQQASWFALWPSQLIYALAWALFTPAILWLSRRYRLERKTWPGRAALHIGAAFLIAVVQRGVYGWGLYAVTPGVPPPNLQLLYGSVIGYFDYGIYIYFIILGLSHALDYANRFAEAQGRAARLDADLAAARLQVLQSQLRPHFLFNTLNSISVLVRDDPEAAVTALEQLSELLRTVLNNTETEETTLRGELGFLDRYVTLERIRYGERLSFHTTIDPTTLDAAIPYMLLQPIVENSLRHGIAAIPGPGSVELASSRSNGRLRITIADSGPGLANTSTSDSYSGGLGLSNIKRRLQERYGDAHTFSTMNGTERGLTVTIDIPYTKLSEP